MTRFSEGWLFWVLISIFVFPGIVQAQGGSQQIVSWNINGTVYVDGVTYPFTFAGLQNAISYCVATPGCPGVDARALTGVLNTGTNTSIVLSKRMFLLLGDVTIVSTANPLVDIQADGVQVIGTGAFYTGNVVNGTVLQDNSNHSNTTTIQINRRDAQGNSVLVSGVTVKNLNLRVTQGQDSGDGISLFNAQRNTFEDIFIDGHKINGTDAIRLWGADYFNGFRRISIGTGNQSFEIDGTATNPSNFNWLENSTVGNAGPGVGIRLGFYASNNTIRNVDLEGCTGAPAAVSIFGDFNVLDSLHIESANQSRPIYINGTKTVVRDSFIDTSRDYGIVIDSGSADTVIDSVRFGGDTSGSIQVLTGAQRTRILNGISTDSTFLANGTGTSTVVWP